MSTGTKVFLVIIGLVLLFLFLNWFKNRDKDSNIQKKDSDIIDDNGSQNGNGGGAGDGGTTNTQPPGWLPSGQCNDVGRTGFYNLKSAYKNDIFYNVKVNMAQWDRMDLYNKYKQEAIIAGIGTDYWAVLEYASWGEAEKKLRDEGFCYYQV